MNKLQLPFTIPNNGMRGQVDGGIRIFLDTPELSNDETAVLFSYRGTKGWCVLAPERQESVEVPEDPAPSPKGASPSQRLRSVIYRYWTENPGSRTFEEFYTHAIEQVIERWKEKLS